MLGLEPTLIFLDALEAVDNFLTTGGPVLYLIAGITLVLWTLMLERYWYFFFNYKQDADQVIHVWEGRKEHKSWYAHAIRNKLISETHIKIDKNLDTIKTLIALCPLFGLLGTVTGMIDVFAILAISSGGDVKSMAGGVSRATIPTMAGMVAALSGVFANIYLTRKALLERQLIEEHMTMDY